MRLHPEESLPLVNGSCHSETSEGGTKYYDSLGSAALAASPLSSTASHRLIAGSSQLRESLRHFSVKVSDLIATHTGSIGTLGSVSIAVNSLTGPAMLSLPATFARSGVIPTACTLVVVCVLSALCCLHMANTVSKVPDNRDFSKEVEFSQAFEHFWGRKWFWITQFLFFGCITCLNISSIVDTTQVVDTFFARWCPWGTAALRVGGANKAAEWVQWDYSACTAHDVRQGDCHPFQPHNNISSGGALSPSLADTDPGGILFSAGDVVTTLFFLPLALMDLKENSLAQIAGFAVLLITSAQFAVHFAQHQHFSWDRVSWWGHSWKDLLGVVMFNFCLVIVVPSWLYERDPHVSVVGVIHGSSLLSLGLYLVLGILGSALPHVSDNMLESILSGSMGVSMELGGSLFAFAIIGLGIPLFSVLTRLNLMGSGMVNRPNADLAAVYLPFAVAWCIDSGHAVTQLLSWGGIAFTGLVVFLLPLLLALHVVRQQLAPPNAGADECDNGSVPVYLGYWTNRTAQVRALYGLLSLTSASLLAAVAGLIVAPQDVPARVKDLVA